MEALIEIAPIATMITQSVKSIYGLIDSMTNTNIDNDKYSDITEMIDMLDIRNKLNTYSLLICEFPGANSESIKSSLLAVKNIILELETKIKSIKNKVDYNKSLWIFISFRSYKFTKDYKDLGKLVTKLDDRINSLKTVIEISKLWNSNLFKDIKKSVIINKYDMPNLDEYYFKNKVIP